jgi:hypothetical protein
MTFAIERLDSAGQWTTVGAPPALDDTEVELFAYS